MGEQKVREDMREREKVEIPRGIGQEVGAALGSGPPSPALASRGQAGAQTLSLPWAQCLQEPHPDAVQAVRAPGLWIQHPGEKDRGQRGGSRGPRAAAGTMDYVEGRLSRPSVGMGGDQEARAEAGLLLWLCRLSAVQRCRADRGVKVKFSPVLYSPRCVCWN